MSQFATNTTLPRYLRDEQDKKSKRYLAAWGTVSTSSPVVFENALSYDHMNEIAAYGGLSQSLPALALRHGVRTAQQELRVRLVEDLRDGDQQQSLVRLLAGGQQPDRPEARDVPRVRPRRLLQEQLITLSPPPTWMRVDHIADPIGRRKEGYDTQSALGRQDGQPRLGRTPHRRSLRHPQGGGVSSTFVCRSRT